MQLNSIVRKASTQSSLKYPNNLHQPTIPQVDESNSYESGFENVQCQDSTAPTMPFLMEGVTSSHVTDPTSSRYPTSLQKSSEVHQRQSSALLNMCLSQLQVVDRSCNEEMCEKENSKSDDIVVEVNVNETVDNLIKSRVCGLTSLLMSLKIPNTSIDRIISYVNFELLPVLFLNNSSEPPTKDEIVQRIGFCQQQMNHESSKHHRGKKIVAESIQSIHKVFGIRYDNVRLSDSGKSVQIPAPCRFSYVPIVQSLQFILRQEPILDHILKKPKKIARTTLFTLPTAKFIISVNFLNKTISSFKFKSSRMSSRCVTLSEVKLVCRNYVVFILL